MYYKQESWFNCKSLGNLGWFYRFLRPMAAILDFHNFMGQILIDFFGPSLYPVGWKTVEKPFVIMFLGSGGISTRLDTFAIID